MIEKPFVHRIDPRHLEMSIRSVMFLLQLDETYFRNLLWTAPELLRMKQPPTYGSQKGDVYSFAIVAQQIAYRAQPYFCENTEPKRMHPLIFLSLSVSVAVDVIIVIVS